MSQNVMSRIRFPVTAKGIGRKDYSLNVELSVEPIVRSHLTRVMWTGRWILPTYEMGVGVWGAPLPFVDLEGNLLTYVPENPKYTTYNLQLTGGSDTLTECTLIKYTRNLVPVEIICKLFDYGEAKVNFKKGYIFEAGYIYYILVNMWTDKPFFEAAFVVTGVVDELAEEFIG